MLKYGKSTISAEVPTRMEGAQEKAVAVRNEGGSLAEGQTPAWKGRGVLAIPVVPEYAGYDPEVEKREYCRSLLSPEQLAELEDSVRRLGYMSVKEIRLFLEQNTTSRFTADGVFALDADTVRELDIRTKEPIFILSDNSVMDKADLYRQYPFAELETTPEKVFAQQELGVFPGRYDPANKEYLVRDLGAPDELVLFEDFLGRIARENYTDRRPLERLVKTKVFLAKEAWEDFLGLVKHIRSMQRFLAPLLAKRGQQAGLLTLLGGGPPPTPALESTDIIEERHRRKEEELRKREEEVAQREKELEKKAAELASFIDGI